MNLEAFTTDYKPLKTFSWAKFFLVYGIQWRMKYFDKWLIKLEENFPKNKYKTFQQPLGIIIRWLAVDGILFHTMQ